MAHNYSFGLFIVPIERDLGWSRASITTGLLIVSVINICLSAGAGALIDRWGARRIAIPGMCCYCAALGALWFAAPVAQWWWAHWVLIGVASVAVNSTWWTSAVAARFDKARGMALATALCGGGLAGIFVPLLTSARLARFDWRTTSLLLAAVLAVVAIPLIVLLFHDRRGGSPQGVQAGREVATQGLAGYDLRETLRSPRYFRLAAATTMTVFGMMAMYINMVLILISRGLSGATAAGIVGLVGIGSIMGRLGAGFLLDRISGTVVGAIAFAMPLVVALALLQADAMIAAAAALLMGLTLGTEMDVVGYLTSRYFGMRKFATIFGSMVGLMAFATGLGPVVGSLVCDTFGSYDWLLIGIMPVFLAAALIIWSLGAYPVFAGGPHTGEALPPDR